MISALAVAKGGISYGALQIAALGFLSGEVPPEQPPLGGAAPYYTNYPLHRGERPGQAQPDLAGMAKAMFPEAKLAAKAKAAAEHAQIVREKIARAEAHDAETQRLESAAALGAKQAEEKRQRDALAEQKKIALMFLLLDEL